MTEDRKSPLVSFAERELARITPGEDDDGMQAQMNAHIIKVVQTFADEGHSGFSASYAVAQLEKLLRFEPLGPLTGEDSEWTEVSDGMWQNNRCSHVFKDGPDARAYDIDGRVFIDPDGHGFTGSGSRVFVTFPYTPSRIEILVGEDGEPLEGPTRAQLSEEA